MRRNCQLGGPQAGVLQWLHEHATINLPSYSGYRLPAVIISHCTWLYFRFALSYRDVEEMMAERGVTVSYESIREWCLKFGGGYTRRIRSCPGRLGDRWHLDEVFLRYCQVNGETAEAPGSNGKCQPFAGSEQLRQLVQRERKAVTQHQSGGYGTACSLT